MNEIGNNSNKKKSIIEKYNSSSFFYDKRYLSIQKGKYSIALKGSNLKDKLILDAGCGTGILIEYFNNNFHKEIVAKSLIIANDISNEMLKLFKLKLESDLKQIKNRVFLILSDIDNLPLRNNIFHAIFSFTSLQNLPNMDKGINELIRVANSNSKVIFSILNKGINIKSLMKDLESKLDNISTFTNENLEDIIILGNVKSK